MKNLPKLIEFVLMAILIAVLGKGLLYGILLGIVFAAVKVISDVFIDLPKSTPTPLSSIAIGGLAGLLVSLISSIL